MEDGRSSEVAAYSSSTYTWQIFWREGIWRESSLQGNGGKEGKAILAIQKWREPSPPTNI
jgi:hypothetical protein